MSEVTPDPANPRLVRDDLIVHENPAPVPTAPAPAPNPEAVAATTEKLNTRITAKFAYEQVTVVVRKLLLLADVPAGIIIDPDERQVSMISFEDEPLRFCLERLRHLVSGSCEVNDQGAVEFAAGV